MRLSGGQTSSLRARCSFCTRMPRALVAYFIKCSQRSISRYHTNITPNLQIRKLRFGRVKSLAYGHVDLEVELRPDTGLPGLTMFLMVSEEGVARAASGFLCWSVLPRGGLNLRTPMVCLCVCVPPPVLGTLRSGTVSPTLWGLQGSAQATAYSRCLMGAFWANEWSLEMA